jgi:glucans biosynthesis protein C
VLLDAKSAGRASRRHDVDVLRAGAFAILIVYHLGLVYTDTPWHVKSTHQLVWLYPVLQLVDRWRMGLIFVLAGISSAFLLGRGPGRAFLTDRSLRLLLPFFFGLVVVVPVQPYVELVGHGLIAPNYLSFLREYLSLRAWPEGAFGITLRLPLSPPPGHFVALTFNHLWYLLYVWLYSVALVLLVRSTRSAWAAPLMKRVRQLHGAVTLWWPLVPLLAAAIWLQPRFSTAYNFVGDWHRNAVFFTLFVYGYAVARDELFWLLVRRVRYRAAGLAALLGLAFSASSQLVSEPTGGPETLVRVLSMLYTWSALVAILGWGSSALNKPYRWLAWANESVFPWYILHQSAIVLFAYWLVPLRLSAPLEALLILGGTVLACVAFTATGKRVAFLRPFTGFQSHFVRRLTRPSGSATSTTSARPTNNPVSTTPGMM